ncbi:MAG: recombinase family protein, partial [Candidatus Nealsonbacteria bacterium]|nr:recombinase family protein [Candidatus Nealsonbacteria bacterium]
MSKIGCLVRVSSKDQNPEGQYEAIRKWLTEHGHDESVARWYEDRETGKHLNRKGFLRLQKDVGAGRVTTIICFHLDRVARNMLDGMITVAGWLEKDVRIVVLTPGFEVRGIMGKAMSTMLFMFA